MTRFYFLSILFFFLGSDVFDFILIWNSVFFFVSSTGIKCAPECVKVYNNVRMIAFDKQTQQCHMHWFANWLPKYTLPNRIKLISTHKYTFSHRFTQSMLTHGAKCLFFFSFWIFCYQQTRWNTDRGKKHTSNAVFCCFKCTIRILFCCCHHATPSHTHTPCSHLSSLAHVHVCSFKLQFNTQSTLKFPARNKIIIE